MRLKVAPAVRHAVRQFAEQNNLSENQAATALFILAIEIGTLASATLKGALTAALEDAKETVHVRKV